MISNSVFGKCKIQPNFFSYYFVRNSHKPLVNMENKPVETSIRQKLKSGLDPIHMDVVNESYMHNVPKGSETHFKVLVVSSKFENLSQLNRHRLVNSILEHELKNGVHALSIVAKTESQWNPEEKIEPSPKCLGGFNK